MSLSENGRKGHNEDHKRTLERAAKLAPIFGPLIPQSGAAFFTFAGESQTVAQILLAPGAGLNRQDRRLAEAHPRIMCDVLADPGTIFLPAPRPADFCPNTLRWAIRGAEQIALWSATFPACGEEFRQWRIDAAKSAKFITTIEATPETEAEWRTVIERWKRKETQLEVFGKMRDDYHQLLASLD